MFLFTHGKSTVSYDPLTGLFVWVLPYRKPAFVGKVATRLATNGYLRLKIGGKEFSAARLAYTLAAGPISDGLEVDHVNRVRSDDRIENLRLVTRAGHLQNRVFPPNRCGHTGVSLHKGGLYRARHKGAVRYFRTAEEAAAGYAALAADAIPVPTDAPSAA